MHPSDEVLVATTRRRELVSFPLGSLETMQDDDEGSGGAYGAFTRLGGAHGRRVTALVGCLSKPLVASAAEDETVPTPLPRPHPYPNPRTRRCPPPFASLFLSSFFFVAALKKSPALKRCDKNKLEWFRRMKAK